MTRKLYLLRFRRNVVIICSHFSYLVDTRKPPKTAPPSSKYSRTHTYIYISFILFFLLLVAKEPSGSLIRTHDRHATLARHVGAAGRRIAAAGASVTRDEAEGRGKPTQARALVSSWRAEIFISRGIVEQAITSCATVASAQVRVGRLMAVIWRNTIY